MSPDTIEAAKAKAREYFAARGTLAPAAALRERIAEAFDSLETFLDTVPPAAAARTAIAGEWTIHEIVDHLVETHRPGLDELWCLLAGRRPPGEAIPAGLQPCDGLRRAFPLLDSARWPCRKIATPRQRRTPWDRTSAAGRRR